MDKNIESVEGEQEPERKPYETPRLVDFGSFAEITQGMPFQNNGTDAGIYS